MNEFVPTDQQKVIIEYPLEPLRVAAGAGTGKTTTIVERIVHLVAEGMDPLRILGITFTNKAADELSLRVVEAIGGLPDGPSPEISTYHGFASSILSEFGVFAGHRRSAALMDEGHRNELAMRVVSRLDTVDLDLTIPSSRRKEMLELSASLTNNLMDVSDLRALAPSDTSDVWTVRLALADAVAEYEHEKRRLGLHEFADLIKFAVEVVESTPEVTAEIASRYDMVVLDEYQDTDAAQRKLLVQLFAGHVPVVAVGDANQTIYAWRGASSENFDAFSSDFPREDGIMTETKALSVNRRSDHLILDLGNMLSELVPAVIGAEALTPTTGAKKGEVLTAWFNTETSEAEWIASEMLMRNADGVAWSDMAVLCRKRGHLKVIADALGHVQVPYSMKSMGELLGVAEIADLLAWMRVLHDPADEPSLLRIWLGGRFRLGLADIAILRRWCATSEAHTLIEAAADRHDIQDLSAAALAKLDVFLELFDHLLQTAQVATASAVTAAVVDTLGFWDEVGALPEAQSITAKINISRFIGVVRQWRPLDGPALLGNFLSYLAALSESDDADALAAAVVTSPDAVTIQTVHTAKGLEWSDVYIPSLAEGVFPSKVRTFDNPDNVAASLPYEMRLDAQSFSGAAAAETEDALKAVLREKHLEEEWRLAYVAVTRAAHRVVLSGHAWDGDLKKPRVPSPFHALGREMNGATSGPDEIISDSAPQQSVYIAPASAPDPLFDEGAAAALRRTIDEPDWFEDAHPDVSESIKDRVAQLELTIEGLSSPTTAEQNERFVVSVTNLVTLAGCPQKFKWIHHDRLPTKPRASAIFGTVFHRRIELHNLGVIAFDDPEPEEDDNAGRERASAGRGETESDPWALFEGSRLATEKPLLVETAFEIAIGESSIRGKIDAIYEPNDGEWEIVDYKSGRHRDDPARDIQLKVYAIAAHDGALSSTPPTAIDVTFAYFGGDELVETTETVDEQWLADARREVESLVDQGRDGPFQTAPSAECTWCDFLHLCPDGQAEVKRRSSS